MFDNAVATLDTAIDAAQEQIETLTGATASPEVIAAEIAELEAEASTTVAVANSTTTATTTTTTTTTTVASGACKCGVEFSSNTSRVVGGAEVNPKNKYPWMVALVDAANSN